MRIKYCLFFLFLIAFSKLFAQEDPRFSFFPWAQAVYNPGAMGEKENHMNFIAILRQQSMGMNDQDTIRNSNNLDDIHNDNKENNKKKNRGNPEDGQQVLLCIDSYIKQIRGAVGVTFLQDRIAGQNNVGFKLGYATRFRVRRGKLGIGVQFGFLNITPTSSDLLNPIQPGDPLLTGSGVSGTESSIMDFDMSFGVHYRTPTWYVGISGTQLLGGVRISGDMTSLRPVRQFYATGGYIWDLKTPIPWYIEPHILIRSNFVEWQLGILAVARYNGILWFGTGFQNGAIPILFGAVPFYNGDNAYLRGLELGVAFGFPTTKFAWTSGGSWGDFELVVRYGFNFYKEKVLSGYGSSRHLYKNQY